MPTSHPFQGGDCVPTEDVVIVVTTLEGDLIGTCIPEPQRADDVVASCSVVVPWGTTVVVTQDMTTVPDGYAPAMNPQTFEVPTSPPDGVFGGPVFLNLPIDASAGDPSTGMDDPAALAEIVGDPSWWIVPFAEGSGNTEEGDLYFGALVRNPSPATVEVGVSFRAYEADGTPFPGCFQPGGGGPGVTTTIAPGETALLRCARTIVPTDLQGLQVAAELWPIGVVETPEVPVGIVEADMTYDAELSSPMEQVYGVSILVEAPGSEDVVAAFRVRFYDDAGVQVGTCDTDEVRIEPEVAQRVTCFTTVRIDTGSPQPVTIRVESHAA